MVGSSKKRIFGVCTRALAISALLLCPPDSFPFDLKGKYAKDKLCLKPQREKEIIKLLSEKGISYEKKADLLEIKLQTTMEALPLLKAAEPFLEGFTAITQLSISSSAASNSFKSFVYTSPKNST